MDAPATTPGPVPGFPAAVGRYRLVAPLGIGGAASVFLARAEGIGGFAREVAIKLMHPHLRQESAYVQDFLREARIAARIRHPHVVPVVDVGEAPEGVFLVMEWVEGLALSDLTLAGEKAGRPIPPRVALKVLCDALAGLHGAHEVTDDQGRPLGLVHRDFTPHNILVATTGVAQLSDFGIAKPTRIPGHTRTGVVKGKIPYMSPEQVQALRIDRRTDVFAAGVIAWELLAGRRMHEAADEAALIVRVATVAPPSLREVAPDLPAGLLAAVDRALMVDPAGRWQTADELRVQLLEGARALGGLADGSEVAAYVREVAGELLAERKARGAAVNAEVEATVPQDASVAPLPGRTRTRTLIVTGVLALGGALAAWWGLRPTAHQHPSPSANVPAVPAGSPSVGAAPPAPPVVAAPAPTPEPKRPPPPARPERKADKVPKKAAPGDPPMADNPYQ